MTGMEAGAEGALGHNKPPPDEELEVQALERAIAALPPGELDASTVVQARALVEREISLRQQFEKRRTDAVRPHLEEQRRINGYWQGLIGRGSSAVEGLKRRISAYLLREEQRRRAEAEEARRQAEAAEERAVEDVEDPFTAFDRMREAERAFHRAKDAGAIADNPPKIVGGGRRALGLKTSYVVEVVDPEALVLHYARHADIVSVATRLAQAQVRAAKGDPCGIPGIAVSIARSV